MNDYINRFFDTSNAAELINDEIIEYMRSARHQPDLTKDGLLEIAANGRDWRITRVEFVFPECEGKTEAIISSWDIGDNEKWNLTIIQLNNFYNIPQQLKFYFNNKSTALRQFDALVEVLHEYDTSPVKDLNKRFRMTSL